MGELDRGGKSALVRCRRGEEGCWPVPGIGPGNGNAEVCDVRAGIDCGRYQPCSVRNRAKICKARWRAAASSSGLGGGLVGEGALGWTGLGA